MRTPTNAATSVRFAFLLCLFGYLSFGQPVFSQSADDANKKTPAPQIPDSPSATVVEGDELLDEFADEGEETRDGDSMTPSMAAGFWMLR